MPPVLSFSCADQANTNWSAEFWVIVMCARPLAPMSAWRPSRQAKSSARSSWSIWKMPLRQQSKRRLTLAVDKWPDSDRCAWEDACRPGSRLKRGGRGSHLAEASRDNLERRYGGFLKFLQRTERLEMKADAAVQVTPANVEAYVQELTRRVSSVSVHTYIYCLRRIAMLLAPANDFSWLGEIEKDLALVMEPRSKFDRFVFSERLVGAGRHLFFLA